MEPFIILAALVFALVVYRLANPDCRWLYKRWRQIVEMRRLQEWNKRESVVTFLPTLDTFSNEIWYRSPTIGMWEDAKVQR